MKAVWEWFSSRWGTISGTVIVVSGIWGFFLNQTINLKSEQINIIREQLNSAREQSSSTREQKSVVEEQNKFLEMQIKYLSEHGPFPQTAQKIEDSIKEIQKKLIPLATLYRFDPLAATVNLGVEGGMQAVFSTDISIKIKEASDYLSNNKYDLASKLSDEIEQELPGFLGADLIRFAINARKGDDYSIETLRYANRLVKEIYIDTLSESSRSNMKKVYYWLIQYYLKEDKKKDAEELTLRAIRHWPEFNQYFEATFGYKPTLN